MDDNEPSSNFLSESASPLPRSDGRLSLVSKTFTEQVGQPGLMTAGFLRSSQNRDN